MKKNSIYKILILASLPFLLVSCFAAKDYERPQVVNEANYRTENLPQDTLSIATLSWKELFTDPTLQGYIEEGLKNNMDIRVALRSEEHTSELQSRENLVCRLLLEKKKI